MLKIPLQPHFPTAANVLWAQDTCRTRYHACRTAFLSMALHTLSDPPFALHVNANPPPPPKSTNSAYTFPRQRLVQEVLETIFHRVCSLRWQTTHLRWTFSTSRRLCPISTGSQTPAVCVPLYAFLRLTRLKLLRSLRTNRDFLPVSSHWNIFPKYIFYSTKEPVVPFQDFRWNKTLLESICCLSVRLSVYLLFNTTHKFHYHMYKHTHTCLQ